MLFVFLVLSDPGSKHQRCPAGPDLIRSLVVTQAAQDSVVDGNERAAETLVLPAVLASRSVAFCRPQHKRPHRG